MEVPEDTTGNKRKVTVAEAAAILGITDRGVRWKIQHDQLEAVQEGKRRYVLLPAVPEAQVEERKEGTEAVTGSESGSAGSVPASDLLNLIREKDQRILELSGQLGYLQSQLDTAREQLKLLAPPAEDQPTASRESSGEDRPRRWWRRLTGR